MLLNVVDQCLSLALATAVRQTTLPRTRAMASRHHWQGPLAAYPRLRAAMEKAEADGLLRRANRMH